MNQMLPLLLVALLVWAGVFAFIFRVDRQTRDLERRLDARTRDRREGGENL